jgi:hypothetical protein
VKSNREGLTWAEWRAAARVRSTPKTRAAWRRGEDPTEWRVGGGSPSSMLSAPGDASAFLLAGGIVAIAGIGVWALVKGA